ncbi:MAG: DUF4129 domain-containing protein [Planctomycetaceae bacterium]
MTLPTLFQEPTRTGPDPESVRRTAEEVLSRPYYQLDAPPDISDTWLNQLFEVFFRMLRAVARFFGSLWDISPILAWLVAAFLTISLALLLAHILWTIWQAFHPKQSAELSSLEDSRRKVDPSELARQAAEAELRGDHILGVRLLYKAALGQIERFEGKPFRPGTTNREHLRRYHSSPLHGWLTRFVTTIDDKWYGYEPCHSDDFAACREAYEQVCLLAVRREDAQRT